MKNAPVNTVTGFGGVQECKNLGMEEEFELHL